MVLQVPKRKRMFKLNQTMMQHSKHQRRYIMMRGKQQMLLNCMHSKLLQKVFSIISMIWCHMTSTKKITKYHPATKKYHKNHHCGYVHTIYIGRKR
ncbi:unnamed protein product [Callosobruchus maculatus]|uniref:Uncharacterized protein n=1 Tax=Callosobruchus maculatus TaxID=64391 RepID=A0A653D8H0_CALMS|nr:unnamed protein product [Callosobruchus maculatus]